MFNVTGSGIIDNNLTAGISSFNYEFGQFINCDCPFIGNVENPAYFLIFSCKSISIYYILDINKISRLFPVSLKRKIGIAAAY